MRNTSNNTGTFYSRAFWHGGFAGRQVGDYLIPGIEVPGYQQFVRDLPEKEFADYRPDFVYATTDRGLAFDFAVQSRQLRPAALYKVIPENPEHDPDFKRGVSFRCLRAQVVSVEPDRFSPSTPLNGASLRHQTWSDGSRLYSNDGYPLPNKTATHFGVNPEHLRDLGYNAPFPAITRRNSETVARLNPGITQEQIFTVMRDFGDLTVPHTGSLRPR